MRGQTFWITSTNAEAVIGYTAKTWYLLAVLQVFVFGVFAATDRMLVGYPFDATLSFAGGYFLYKRKSRAVAVVMILWALTLAALTARYGTPTTFRGGTNWVLASASAVSAGCGIWATFVYHRSHGTRIVWTRVLAISGVSALGALTVAVAMIVAAEISRRLPDTDVSAIAFFAAVIYAFVAVMAALTRRFPLARPGIGEAFVTIFS